MADEAGPGPAPRCGKPIEHDALFGGAGRVRVWDLLGQRAVPPFSAVLSCELEAHGSVGRHVQQRDPEIVIGLAGRGEATVDDTVGSLQSGSVVYLEHGSVLAIRNCGDEPLRYLIIKARG